MWLRNIRRATLALGVSNLFVILLGGFVVLLASPACGHTGIAPFAFVSVLAGVRIAAMVRIGIAQEVTAMAIIESSSSSSSTVTESAARHERRMRYLIWLWWARCAMFITLLQFGGASYLVFHLAKHISHDGAINNCILGALSNGNYGEKKMFISFMILVCSVALLQCFTGYDVLRWRSFYATQDSAWKSHYQEVFDHGIREALCCLGRAKYLSVLEDDEVYSVARLLGDLVAYHASGTGYLEFLAGLALLQRRNQFSALNEGSVEASTEQIQGAVFFHPFAEAAYTGPLLDFGRHLVLFPCAWLYRQGILTSWARNRRPVLEGDNWWRGHAAAFLKQAKLSPDTLRRGRVGQGKCEAAYFIVVLHHIRSVVISVRGTETPEDLITDGLCRECSLSDEDLNGLINSTYIHPDVRQSVVSSFPHYGHSGIVAAARDLFMQIEGNSLYRDVEDPEPAGFLASLLGVGGECEGYDVRIVGHSLGGAIAALLGIRLYERYPNLRVYAYGPPPCVDSVIAHTCTDFVTSIVYNNEFSARLSAGSILRLRAAAIEALSEDIGADTAALFQLARRFVSASNCQGIRMKQNNPSVDFHSATVAADVGSVDDPATSQLIESVKTFVADCSGDPADMFLPGHVIHIVPPQSSYNFLHLWSGFGISQRSKHYKAYIASRESFKDVIVSPSMFLDHLPWRCRCGLQKVLEARAVDASVDPPELV